MTIEQIIIDIAITIVLFVFAGDIKNERRRVNKIFDGLIKRVERLERDGK